MSAAAVIRSAMDVMREEIRKEVMEELRAKWAASKLRRQEEALRRKALREEEALARKAARQEFLLARKAEKEEAYVRKAARKVARQELLLARKAEKEAMRQMKLQHMEPAYVTCECGCVLRATSMRQHLKTNKHACFMMAQETDSDSE